MRRLREVQQRSLAGERWVALLIDGKSFADDQLVIALGVTVRGEKRVLGLVETATENQRVCAAFLRELVERGFHVGDGLLVVLDGAKGLRTAVAEVFGTGAQVQRCQWHKRENVVRHLPPGLQPTWRRKLQAAYEQPTYAQAKAALRLLLAGAHVLKELEVVRQRAHALRARNRLAKVRVARSRNAER